MTRDDIADLAEAVRLLRHRATDSITYPGERWMVDQSPDNGLVVGCYGPDDISPDGWVSTGCVAYLAYPGDEDNRTHKHAVPAAAHMAGLDPAVALELAEWLDESRRDLESAGGVEDSCDSPGEIQRAVRLARIYLRKESDQ